MDTIDVFLHGESETPVRIDGEFGFDPNTLSYIVKGLDGRIHIFPIRSVQMIVRTPGKVVSIGN